MLSLKATFISLWWELCCYISRIISWQVSHYSSIMMPFYQWLKFFPREWSIVHHIVAEAHLKGFSAIKVTLSISGFSTLKVPLNGLLFLLHSFIIISFIVSSFYHNISLSYSEEGLDLVTFMNNSVFSINKKLKCPKLSKTSQNTQTHVCWLSKICAYVFMTPPPPPVRNLCDTIHLLIHERV